MYITGVLVDHGKELGFYSKCDGKSLRIFNTQNAAQGIEYGTS